MSFAHHLVHSIQEEREYALALEAAESEGMALSSGPQFAPVATRVNAKGLTGNPLLKNALRPFKGGTLTNAGRALTKHPEVIGQTKDALRQALRSDEAINVAASEALKNIMRNGVRTTHTLPRYGDVIQYQLPGGHGARWYSSGEFIGFINP